MRGTGVLRPNTFHRARPVLADTASRYSVSRYSVRRPAGVLRPNTFHRAGPFPRPGGVPVQEDTASDALLTIGGRAVPHETAGLSPAVMAWGIKTPEVWRSGSTLRAPELGGGPAMFSVPQFLLLTGLKEVPSHSPFLPPASAGKGISEMATDPEGAGESCASGTPARDLLPWLSG